MPVVRMMETTSLLCYVQIDVVNAEAYHYDGDCIAKAEDMGFQGLVDIKQQHVRNPDFNAHLPLQCECACASAKAPCYGCAQF